MNTILRLFLYMILIFIHTLSTEPLLASSHTSSSEKAMIHKKQGDELFLREDLYSAAKEYLEAWRLSRDFPKEEVLRMAIRISWANFLKESEQILRELLEKHPEYYEATIHLARVLSWQDKQHEALRTIEKVLSVDPQNYDAMLVKANSLRYLGRPDLSLKLTDHLLVKREDFDVRLSKTYALANLKLPKEAKRNLDFLKPLYPYQEGELRKLKEHLKTTFGPSLSTGISYFQDSDENEVWIKKIGIDAALANYIISINYNHITASDHNYYRTAEELKGSIERRLNDRVLLQGGLNFLKSRDNIFLTPRLRINTFLHTGDLTLFYDKSILVDSRLLIDNIIRVNSFGFNIAQRLTDFLTIYGFYSYRTYSDNNKANVLNGVLLYKLRPYNPYLAIGLRTTYMDFKRQTQKGYFDPENFWSNQLFVSISQNRENYKLFIEPYVGYQSFERYNKYQTDKILGLASSFTYKVLTNLEITVNADGGNYAGGTTTGWKYYQVGLSIRAYF